MSTTLKALSIGNYLEEVMQSLDPDRAVILNESHRKPMMRALVGTSRVLFDQRLREVRAQVQWAQSKEFVETYLLNMPAPSVEEAPQYEEVLQNYETFQERPQSLFCFLARGRNYKGKFESILEDKRPDLLSKFSCIFDEVSDHDLLKAFVEDFASANPERPDLVKDLNQCLNFQLGASSPQPADGGSFDGKKCEMDLLAYLHKRLQSNNNDTKANESRLEFMSPVWIQCRNKNNGRRISKRCKYVIELPSNISLDGVTSELDAVIVKRPAKNDLNDPTKDEIQITEVWEAKSTLHPWTLLDALSKKHRAITTIFKHMNDSLLIVDGTERNSICPLDPAESTSLPRLGIFSKAILHPRAAARRIQLVLADQLIESNRTIVREALNTGEIVVPFEHCKESLQQLMDLCHELDPILIVGSDLDVLD